MFQNKCGIQFWNKEREFLWRERTSRCIKLFKPKQCRSWLSFEQPRIIGVHYTVYKDLIKTREPEPNRVTCQSLLVPLTTLVIKWKNSFSFIVIHAVSVTQIWLLWNILNWRTMQSNSTHAPFLIAILQIPIPRI